MYMTETKGVKWILEYLEYVHLIWLKRFDDLDRVSFLFVWVASLHMGTFRWL